MRQHTAADFGGTDRRRVPICVVTGVGMSVGCGQVMCARMRVLVMRRAHGRPGERNRERQQQAGEDVT